jgi:PAS domain S-box-containing protein
MSTFSRRNSIEEPCDMTPSKQDGPDFSAEAKAECQHLFEHSPLMYFMVDPVGAVLAVNTFGAAQLGYTVRELVGQSVLKVFFSDDKETAARNLELCVQTFGQQIKWEIRKVRKDGKLLWVRENATAVRQSDGSLIVLIAGEDISDRKRGEQRLAAQYGVTRVLAESDSLAAATPKLLRTICEAMGWDWGAFWSGGQQPQRLRCDCIWRTARIDSAEFDAASRELAFSQGEGRAGQVWQTGQPLWIADVTRDPGFLRGPAAARAGLHTGLACPILLGQESLGIMEFFSCSIREPDEQELATLSALGSQIGQFIRRKRAEQAVQASEKRFRALIEHAYDVVLLTSAEGTVLYVSPSIKLMLGYAPEELIGRNGFVLIHPDHLQEAIGRFTRAVQQSGGVITGERLLLHKDGSARWAENVIVNLLSETNVQAVVMHLRDVTERKRAEEALCEGEERFRALVQFSFDVYWETDAQHRFTRQEHAECLADAPAPGSEMGKTRWEVPYLEPDEEAWRKHRQTLEAHLPFRDFELARPTPDGGKRYVSVSGLPVFDKTGNFLGYRGVGRHITVSKRAEAALRESEQRFRDYAEIASDWLWESGPDHRFTHFSGSAAHLEYAEQALGKTRWDLAADREEEPVKWSTHIATLEAHQPFRGFRYRPARPDGSVNYTSVSGKPVFDPDGKFLGYRGVASDVTAEIRSKQAEQALREAQTELAHFARVTTLGELTASIAHEINQPLGAVVTHAGAGLRWLDGQVPNLEQTRQTLNCIIKDANRAGDVLARIRALTKKTPFQKEQLDINDVILEVIALTRSERDRNRVELRTHLAGDLPPVQADRIELQQLLLNLIINAIEAMRDCTRRDMLIASTNDDGNCVRVSVCDSGRGLDPAPTDQIFQAFYTTKPDGMGMGLAICRSIIARIGGRLVARANEPSGTIFEFSIPLTT